MGKAVIFGAKSIALGVCRAIQTLYPDRIVDAFLVSSREDNPASLAGLPVRELADYPDREVQVLIATPEDIQPGIREMLQDHGFMDCIGIDSAMQSDLMRRYYERSGEFAVMPAWTAGKEGSGHVPDAGSADVSPDFRVYMACFYKDKPLNHPVKFPEWLVPIQVGAVLTDQRMALLTDDNGEHISYKNPNYCELTALYWMWKNAPERMDYLGLFHYRRWLELPDETVKAAELLRQENADAVLPYPMLHEPDIREHHARYIRETDWQAALQAVRELAPEYYAAYDTIFAEPYLYNYNILVARRDILHDYCAWLFPILERTEELSEPRGCDRKDRYIGYIAENLLTLYFRFHRRDMRIVHTGVRMLV